MDRLHRARHGFRVPSPSTTETPAMAASHRVALVGSFVETFAPMWGPLSGHFTTAKVFLHWKSRG